MSGDSKNKKFLDLPSFGLNLKSAQAVAAAFYSSQYRMEPFGFSPSVFVSPSECNSKATLAVARWVVIQLMVAGLTRICAAAATLAAAKSYV